MIQKTILSNLLACLSLACLLTILCSTAGAQTIKDASYNTLGHIKQDGRVQDSGYRTIGYVKSDGRVQDASYRTIGYAKDVPVAGAALFFFFQ